MESRWNRLCERVGAGEDAAWMFVVVRALHEFPARAYHNLGHVAACLRVLDEFPGEVGDRDAVELALWLHDCVYDAARKDNEERSAAVAGMVGREFGLSVERVELVRRLIMATRHAGGALSGDERVIVDIDLSVLGAAEAEYDAYAAGVREEYAFVDDASFAAGRAAFLRGMLAREWVYQSVGMRAQLERRARGNMERELE